MWSVWCLLSLCFFVMLFGVSSMALNAFRRGIHLAREFEALNSIFSIFTTAWVIRNLCNAAYRILLCVSLEVGESARV